MMVLRKLIVSLALVGIVAFGAVAEGNGESSTTVEERPLVFVTSTGGMAAADDAVRVVMQDAFYEDRGEKIALEHFNVPTGEILTKVNLMIASREQIDGFLAMEPDMTSHVAKTGFLKNLREDVDAYGPNIKKKVSAARWKSVSTGNNEVWALPGMGESNIAQQVYVRQDILDDLGISEMPASVLDWEPVLQKIKDAGMIPVTGNWYDLMAIFAADGGGQLDTWYEDSDGTLKPAFMFEEYKDILRLYADWFKKGLFDQEILGQPWDHSQSKMKQGRAPILFGQWWFYWYVDEVAKNAIDAGVDYRDAGWMRVIDPPAGPNGGVGVQGQLPALRLVAVPAVSENSDLVVKWNDFLHSNKEMYQLGAYGVEGINWTAAGEGKRNAIALEEIPEDDVYTSRWYILDIPEFNLIDANFKEPTIDNLNVIHSGNYPHRDADDIGLLYNFTRSTDYLDDLNNLRNENLQRTLTGAQPVSEWDDFVQKWLDMGGDVVIEERNEQYRKLK